VTGGIASNFSSLYLLPIIAASMIRSRRVALQVAALSAFLYLGLVSTQYLELDMPQIVRRFSPAVELPTLGVARYTVAINLSGFFAVALLAGSLAESLRSAGARLEYASHEIRDLRKFNEYVINSLLSGLMTTDADRRILTFNRAASVILGIPSGQALRRDAIDVLQLPPDVQPRLEGPSDGRSLRIDWHHKTAEGRTIDLGLTASPLIFPDGRTGYLFTFQDVTDVRRIEREGRLKQRLAAVGEMAAGIAHEIRNPLASMSGSIQVLRQELSLSDEQAQLMDIVLRESERLNDTIKSFLAYARPQRSALARLDIRKVVQDAAALLRNNADVREDHTIDVDVPGDPVWCEADENQMRQIVWNLATNGLRAMGQGGRLLLTVATANDGSGATLLTVQDEGCGIRPEDLDLIFQPFHSSFEKGTGLGLSIVHRVVTDYNGTIDVSSRVGVGTVVTVRLPMRGAITVIDAPAGELASSESKAELQKAVV
jgi:two-component system sensor histidine kinase PilS (NtrC family)